MTNFASVLGPGGTTRKTVPSGVSDVLSIRSLFVLMISQNILESVAYMFVHCPPPYTKAKVNLCWQTISSPNHEARTAACTQCGPPEVPVAIALGHQSFLPSRLGVVFPRESLSCRDFFGLLICSKRTGVITFFLSCFREARAKVGVLQVFCLDKDWPRSFLLLQ